MKSKILVLALLIFSLGCKRKTDFDGALYASNYSGNLSAISSIDGPKGYNLNKKGVIIKKGGNGWKNFAVEGPGVVFWDSLIGKYRMTVIGYSGDSSAQEASLGTYVSSDLETWTEPQHNPFFSKSNIAGSVDEFGTTGGFVFLERNVYHMFYIGLTSGGYEGGVKRICHATSTDFVNWHRLGAVITPNASFNWRNNAVWKPNIIKNNGIYYLFFNADGGGGNESIGYATSTDLNKWSVDDVHSPLLTKTGSGWESNFVGDPMVIKIGNIFYMHYFGVGDGGASDGIATTTKDEFPLGWKRFIGNPVLTKGNAGSYDDTYAHKPAIVCTANNIYHFYTSVGSSEGRQVALAIDHSKF